MELDDKPSKYILEERYLVLCGVEPQGQAPSYSGLMLQAAGQCGVIQFQTSLSSLAVV